MGGRWEVSAKEEGWKYRDVKGEDVCLEGGRFGLVINMDGCA